MIVTEKLKIKNLHKYGFFTDKDESVNWGPRFTDKVNLVPGVEAELVLFVANSGKRYVNELKGISKAPPKEESKPEANVEVKSEAKTEFKKPKAQADTTMTKSEWIEKDRRISRQGCIQAAVQALAPVVSLELLEEESIKLAESMLRFVNEV